MKRTIMMTEAELNRSKVMQMVEEKRFTQREGAQRLEISERHFRRLLHSYREKGDEGLISGHRSKVSNHRMSAEKRKAILDLLLSTYEGFGPTLASEKLEEREGIRVSKETVRQILIAEGKHRAKVKKKERAYCSRERRARWGELIQIDGSYHLWLEDRAEKACLILFVDDATSQILAARFVTQESFFAYAEVCKAYFAEIGLPEAFYSDKFSVFRVNAPNTTHSDALTQFGRAMKELDVQLICANSPQAKGRVERANQTFQDRLIKEMRLEQISDYEKANEFLPVYIQMYNAKFSVQPRSSLDAHRPLDPDCDLERILSWQETRIISKSLQIQFDKTVYQVVSTRPAYALQQREVIVAQNAAEEVTFLLNNSPLKVQVFHHQPKQAEVVSAKKIAQTPNIPAVNHPWRSYGKKINGSPSPAPD
jgi:predicted DNA-binding protein (UPF0251 family)